MSERCPAWVSFGQDFGRVGCELGPHEGTEHVGHAVVRRHAGNQTANWNGAGQAVEFRWDSAFEWRVPAQH